MREKLREIGKGIKKFVDEKVKACKEVLTNAQNRKILGVIIIGLGTGLLASGYIR